MDARRRLGGTGALTAAMTSWPASPETVALCLDDLLRRGRRR
jgi:hypothetical protein